MSDHVRKLDMDFTKKPSGFDAIGDTKEPVETHHSDGSEDPSSVSQHDLQSMPGDSMGHDNPFSTQPRARTNDSQYREVPGSQMGLHLHKGWKIPLALTLFIGASIVAQFFK